MNRLIEIEHDGTIDSLTAMERDIFLLKNCEKYGNTIFRTYMWDHPTISLGRLQKKHEIINPDSVKRAGINIVQRPTGGRHIFHGEDISFSLIIPPQNIYRWGQTVDSRTQQISSYIAKAFSSLGINLGKEDQNVSRAEMIHRQKAPCFLTTTPSELTYKGKKLVGIAQLVHVHGILIQGTIPLTDTHTTLPLYERIPVSEQDRQIMKLSAETSNLRDICGIEPSYSELSGAFTRSFLNER